MDLIDFRDIVETEDSFLDILDCFGLLGMCVVDMFECLLDTADTVDIFLSP